MASWGASCIMVQFNSRRIGSGHKHCRTNMAAVTSCEKPRIADKILHQDLLCRSLLTISTLYVQCCECLNLFVTGRFL